MNVGLDHTLMSIKPVLGIAGVVDIVAIIVAERTKILMEMNLLVTKITIPIIQDVNQHNAM